LWDGVYDAEAAGAGVSWRACPESLDFETRIAGGSPVGPWLDGCTVCAVMTISPSREELIAQLRSISQRLGTRGLSRSQYMREGGASEWQILKHFDSWNAYVSAAGLEPTDVSRIEDERLFEAMREAFLQAGGIVTRTHFRKLCRYSDYVYAKRWGRWRNVLRRFRAWAEEHAPEFPYLAELPEDIEASDAAEIQDHGSSSPVTWPSSQRTQLGPFLNFRGLQHAPINEQGVVFMFGMVALDLGYMVEGVGTGFPDCEAKRCVAAAGNKWERVWIEFEFRSRTFRDHGHDPAGCDLIVCWEHNWPECPVEVLELRSAIEHLGE
jgi:hypothetical protein